MYPATTPTVPNPEVRLSHCPVKQPACPIALFQVGASGSGRRGSLRVRVATSDPDESQDLEALAAQVAVL